MGVAIVCLIIAVSIHAFCILRLLKRINRLEELYLTDHGFQEVGR